MKTSLFPGCALLLGSLLCLGCEPPDNPKPALLHIQEGLNLAPQLEETRYEPSKFVCRGVATVCVIAKDANKDRLRFRWRLRDSRAAIVVQEDTRLDETRVESCATVEIDEPATYELNVVVRDLAQNSRGRWRTLENLLSTPENRVRSRDNTRLPLHALAEGACIE